MENVGYLRERLTNEMTIQKVARDAGISRTTVYKAVKLGQPVRSSVATKLKRVLEPNYRTVDPAILREVAVFVKECDDIGVKAARLNRMLDKATREDGSLYFGSEPLSKPTGVPTGQDNTPGNQLTRVNECRKSLDSLVTKASKALKDVNALGSRLAELVHGRS